VRAHLRVLSNDRRAKVKIYSEIRIFNIHILYIADIFEYNDTNSKLRIKRYNKRIQINRTRASKCCADFPRIAESPAHAVARANGHVAIRACHRCNCMLRRRVFELTFDSTTKTPKCRSAVVSGRLRRHPHPRSLLAPPQLPQQRRLNLVSHVAWDESEFFTRTELLDECISVYLTRENDFSFIRHRNVNALVLYWIVSR